MGMELKPDVMLRALTPEDCTPSLLHAFDRYQDVKRCWRKEDGRWMLKDIAFVEQWDEAEKQTVIERLAKTLRAGGVVVGAYGNGQIMGFASVDAGLMGARGEYVKLDLLHVSREFRGQGIGKRLFQGICPAAREMGAAKLYISAHSSEESQAFYRAMGCVDTAEIIHALFEKEPCDCHLEYGCER